MTSIVVPEHISYLCIEGVIGAGKTTLCSMIADELDARVIYEEAEQNPFLAEFYSDRTSAAFQTQLWFLLSRYRQLTNQFVQQDLFHALTISDYIFAKDNLFASVNLDENELALYKTVANIIQKEVLVPDFVVYLQASTETLLRRIAKRDRTFERNMDAQYIASINDAYNQYFFHYTGSPVLIINTDNLDFVEHREDFEEIMEQLKVSRWGSNYYNPASREDRAVFENIKVNEHEDN